MTAFDMHGGQVRKIWSTESARLKAHFLRLDRDGRRLRFGHSVSDDFVAEYAARTCEVNGVTYGFVKDGEIRAVAELRKLGDRWDDEAEAAFSVENEWRNKGLGTVLMGRIIAAAHTRGVHHLYISCLAENTVMQRIARKHGAKLRFECGDVIGDIVPEAPTYGSIFDEVVDDTHAFMVAVLDLRSALVKAA